jgi:type IV secretory pathway TrbL component
MTSNQLMTLVENWSGHCGPPSTVIELAQVAALAVVIVLSFRSAKMGMRKYLVVSALVSAVPILCGVFFYRMGLAQVEKSLQAVDPSMIASLKQMGEMQALSCLLGSVSYLIWIFAIMILTGIYHFLRQKRLAKA